MFGEDFKKCRRHINKKTTREYLPPSQGKYPSEKLPLHQRWTAKRFQLKEVFQPMKPSESHREEVDWFFDCREWEEYMKYFNSGRLISHPGEEFTRARKHNKIT